MGTAAHKCEWNDIDTICFKQPHTHINIYNIFIYDLYRISYFWHTVLLIPSLLQFVGASSVSLPFTPTSATSVQQKQG